MAKTNTQNEIGLKTKLLISREDFIRELKKCIDDGRKLLDIKVEPINSSSYNYGGFYTHRTATINYNEQQFELFRSEFHRWNDYNIELLKQRFNKPNNEYHAAYVPCGQPAIITSRSDSLKLLRDEITDKIHNLESLINKLPLIPVDEDYSLINDSNHNSAKNKSLVESNKVFIVHGHDSTIRLEVENLIKDLGFEPVVLFKAPDKGQTIIEKLESETQNVCFAIIIYSHCDDGKAKDEEKLKPRARQNVVFEHGMMCAKLGRSRVVALLEDGIEQPGDINGVLYKLIDPNGSWKYAVAKEMKAAGLPVDLNNIK